MRSQFKIIFKAAFLLGLLASTASPAAVISRDLARVNGKAGTRHRGIDPIEPPVTVPKTPIGDGAGSIGAPPRIGSGEGSGDPPPRFGTDPAPPALPDTGAPPPRIGSDPAAPADPFAQDPDDSAATSVQDPAAKGESNLNALQDAITKNSPSVDHGYGAKFQKDYVAERTPQGEPGTLDHILTEETLGWLNSKGVDIDDQTPDPGLTKIEIWADQTKTQPSIFQCYIKPSDGTMYITRAYRTVDSFYPSLPNVNDRIPISEHMNQAWVEVAGNTPIQKVVTANIVNTQTEQLLQSLSTKLGTEQLELTVSEGDNWNELMAGVAGSPVVRWLTDHHAEPHIGNRQPQSADWRYGDEGILYKDLNDAGVTDIFVIMHIG